MGFPAASVEVSPDFGGALALVSPTTSRPEALVHLQAEHPLTTHDTTPKEAASTMPLKHLALGALSPNGAASTMPLNANEETMNQQHPLSDGR